MNRRHIKQTARRTALAGSLAVAGVLAAPMLEGTYTHNLMPIGSAQAAEHAGHGGGEMKGQGGPGGSGGVSGGMHSMSVDDILRGGPPADRGGDGRPDDKGPPEGDGPSTGMGGGNPNAGDRMGDLYGDLYVVKRDPLTGEPILDDLGRLQMLDADGNVIPYLSDDPDDEGFTEFSPENEALLQEVEFDRLNLARSPQAVLSHALDTALDTIALDADGVLQFDAGGRVVVEDADGVIYTIDSPLENLALYQDAVARLNDDVDGNETFTLEQTDSLLAAAASKFGNVSLDMVVYLNTILGLNTTADDGTVDYVDLAAYSYDRTAAYTDSDGNPIMVTYLTDPEGDGTYITVTESVIDAVFGGETAAGDGATGYALSTDDALQVIEFIHEPIH
ncbi:MULTISPECIES: hypothetical protein [unclassified Guyparkeria]|uniref:hypothetical protein n=1 Tax=unclassified Guyparkeria TaxID=2626246 RepID=UPI0007333BE5|nr:MULTISPECIES: hypothetical protein [unclassified Guyparkeria]KTG17510.1 hypothetical protein AUR63_07580 [Guyparkeria sp. XI15]OAE88325.1 hypothetical protein AWR35_07595 [Guyparkeria sp. WRN-7]